MTHDPEMLADAFELLRATGFIKATPDPLDPNSVLISAAPKLVAMLEARGVTLADIGRRR